MGLAGGGGVGVLGCWGKEWWLIQCELMLKWKMWGEYARCKREHFKRMKIGNKKQYIKEGEHVDKVW